MKRKTRNAAKTKQEIIEKSAPIFNKHGYAGTKMQMLVDATGYQMGGIYRHFETKMDLGKAVFEYNYKALVQPNLEIDPELNPKEKLLRVLQNYKRMVLKPRVAGGCPLMNTAMEVDDTNEAFRQLTKSYIERVLTALEIILEEGKSTGYFKSDIDVRKEAEYLFSCVQGAIMLVTTLKEVQPLFDIFERVVAYLEERVLEGL